MRQQGHARATWLLRHNCLQPRMQPQLPEAPGAKGVWYQARFSIGHLPSPLAVPGLDAFRTNNSSCKRVVPPPQRLWRDCLAFQIRVRSRSPCTSSRRPKQASRSSLPHTVQVGDSHGPHCGAPTHCASNARLHKHKADESPRRITINTSGHRLESISSPYWRTSDTSKTGPFQHWNNNRRILFAPDEKQGLRD
ncbi:hypothetical protein PV04_01609 [Phialophora macrospora]|uniref:Uncharacterized protein n=1 Tax=Phialophora macrospora TaxID=1851006 RepID=A0A0D2D7G8_9EURO|nr:hypothetical protein PV04_01609 [Phialophora macrospora]